MTQLRHPFGPGQISQLMRTQIGQPGVVRQPIGDQLLCRAGQHGLAAVRQVAQPGGAVDGRTDVVALVPQLHLAGMHADAQLDRCQCCPLQRKGAVHRVAGTGERHDEAVALALFDRTHPAVGGQQVGKSDVEPCDSVRHLRRLGLPQPRRAFDVGQQQRHRSGGKLAHEYVAPLSFAHASQHPVAAAAKHQRKRAKISYVSGSLGTS